MRYAVRLLPFAGLLLVAAAVRAGPAPAGAATQARTAGTTDPQPGPVWPTLSAAEREEVMRFGEDFKQFIGRAKSEMTFVREATALAEASGFRRWPGSPSKTDVKPGSRWYAVNRDRTVVVFVMGAAPLATGARIVNTHNDSVRIDLKPRPLRESVDIALFDTQVHGGLKNYQWVNRPLALIGRVNRADDTIVWVDIGNAPSDPVLMITDLAPHVDRDFLERKNRDVIQTEELDPIVGSTIDATMRALKEKYNLEAGDFLSADLQLVPAQMPVDVGLDRQFLGAYGHDDRSGGFAALRAIADVKLPPRTAMAYMVNNEEVNSWTTGVDSEWFRTLLAEIIAAERDGAYNDLTLRRALRASQVLVSDCTTAVNPDFPQPFAGAIANAARIGWGLVFKEYGSGRQADGEYFAQVRKIFNDAGVSWQTHSYKAGYGGGTIAQWFANADIDAIDVGIGILSMHSPMEVAAKVDLWELVRGFKAFLSAPAPGSPSSGSR